MEGTNISPPAPGKRRSNESRADRSAWAELKERWGVFRLDTPVLLSILGIVLVGTLLWHQTHIKCWFPHTRRTDRPAIISQASMTFTLQRSRFLLFGDSLTERGFGLDGWAAGLAHQFQRRVDVINRGFGGYNTHWALHLAPDVLHGTNAQNTRLATLFFGANDAARPDGPSKVQHVTLKEYKDNLRQLVARIRATGVKRIVLLTPPPVYDQGRKEWQIVKVGEEAAALLTLDRTLDFTADYAKACMAVAQELELPVINLYDTMQQAEDWGSLYFVDGLHFTAEGNRFVFNKVLETLEEAYPDLSPEAMPLHFPPWDTVTDEVLASFAGLRKQGEFAEGPLPAAYHPAGNLTKPKP